MVRRLVAVAVLVIALHVSQRVPTYLNTSSRAARSRSQRAAVQETVQDSEFLSEVKAALGEKAFQWSSDLGAASWTEILEHSDDLVKATGDPELLGRLLCCASAGGALPPSLALLKSPSLRPAVRILLELQRLEGQQAAARVAARPAAEAAVRLMTLGNNLAEEVTVQQGDGLKIDGLRTSGHEEDGWGQWASYFVAEGPEDLIGQRLVACKRVGGERIVGEKGFLDSKGLALMFREGLDERGVVAPPEMLEAAKFLNSIQDRMAVWKHMCERARAKAGREEWMSFEMSTLTCKAERRLYRFEKSPLARRAFEDLQLDELWAEFWPALTPRLPEIYKALRKAMLRARPLQKMEPRRVSVVRINVLGVIGLLVVFGALAWGAWQYFQSSSGPEDLPLYTLRSEG
eukprot:g11104.t1